MADTNIEWADAVWNPLAGCTRISPGCQHCYAERMAKRLVLMGKTSYAGTVDAHGRWTGRVNLIPEKLNEPLRRKKPTTYFVNSMSDLFHENVPDEYIGKVFATMQAAHWHRFIVLTKRAENMRKLCSGIGKPLSNVILGVSVESQAYIERVEQLIETNAFARCVSAEPLLGPVDLTQHLHALDWVIVGGESGPGARPMHRDWVLSLKDQCVSAGVPFFFKQWGGTDKKKTGRLLDGVEWLELPAILRRAA